jgi:hypothetical protein
MDAAIARPRGFPMAMVTWLQAVSEAELARLRAEPDTIGRLDVPDVFRTHYECSLDYFLTGEAYPVDHPLANVLSGTDHVGTSTLETGGFGASSPAQVAALASELANVDPDRIRAEVAAADLEALGDADVDDAEILAEAEDPARTLSDEVRALAAFYAKAAANGHGVVAYTA